MPAFDDCMPSPIVFRMPGNTARISTSLKLSPLGTIAAEGASAWIKFSTTLWVIAGSFFEAVPLIWYVCLTGCAASLVYGINGSVDVHSAAVMSISALLAAPVGARMTMVLENKKLKRLLGYFLFSAGALTSLQAVSSVYLNGGDDHEDNEVDDLKEQRPSSFFLAGLGLVAGYASGLLGIGGGTVLTPLLAVATPMPQTLVLGTSLMATIAPSMVGLFQHYRLGNIDWILGAGLAAGTFMGGFIGSNFALAAPESTLKGIFAITMLALGRLTLLKAK